MLKEDLKISHKTYLVKKSNLPAHQEAPEEEAPVQVTMVIVRHLYVSQ